MPRRRLARRHDATCRTSTSFRRPAAGRARDRSRRRGSDLGTGVRAQRPLPARAAEGRRRVGRLV